MTGQQQQGGNNNGGDQGGGAGGAGGQGGGAAPPWYGEIPATHPQEFREWVGNKGFKDPISALESYHNAEKLIGAPADQIIKLPKADDAAGMRQVWARLGMPEKADAYELPLPAGDGDGGDGSFSKTVASWMHELGMPKAMGQGLAKRWNDHMSAFVQQRAQEAKAKADGELTALKTEWGNGFDQNAEVGRRGLAEYGRKAGLDDNDLKGLEETLGTGKMLRMFHTLGLTLGEHKFTGGDTGTLGVTPQQARLQLDEARQKRMENKISEADFMKLMDRLGPLASKAA